MNFRFTNIETENRFVFSVFNEYYTEELERLIDRDSFTNITRFAERFTKNLSPFFGYEVQLGSESSTADLLLCISNPDFFSDYVNSEIKNISENKFDDDTLIGLESFSRFWSEKNHLQVQPVNNIWFEFDYNEIGKNSPKACFFFGPKLSINKLEMLLLTKEIFQRIFQKNIEPFTLKALLGIYHILGEDQFISQIGMMNSRGDKNLRLFIQGKDKFWIPKLLSEMDYPFAGKSDFKMQLDECNKLASTVDLDIDIYETIGNKIGLECYFKSTDKALLFLEQLTQKGLVLQHKAYALKEYLLRLKTYKSRLFQPFFSHFKLVYHLSNGFYAKAYIGYVNHKLLPNVIQTKPAKIKSYEKN